MKINNIYLIIYLFALKNKEINILQDNYSFTYLFFLIKMFRRICLFQQISVYLQA